MDEKEKEEKIAALRGELKNGRVETASRTGEEPGGDSRDINNQDGTTFQVARGAINQVVRDSNKPKSHHKQPGSNGRGTKAQPLGIGQSDRRSGESDSRFSLDSAEQPERGRSVGRILTDDPISPRKIELDRPEAAFDPNSPPPKKGPWVKPKQPKEPKPKREARPFIPKGHTFSKQEAQDKAEELTAALESDFDNLDEYLWMRQKAVGIDTQEAPV